MSKRYCELNNIVILKCRPFKNMKRILGNNFENKNINKMLTNRLYKYFKVNLKGRLSYAFD